MSSHPPSATGRGPSVLVIPLGEASRAEVAKAVARHFPSADVHWLNRGDLRRRPLRLTSQLMHQHHDAAVLVASDLQQPRLRLTSLVLALPRALSRWRIDLRGNRAGFGLCRHLARTAPP